MNVAEALLGLAQSIQNSPRSLVLCSRIIQSVENDMARSALALKLASRPDISFRAMMDNWDMARIIRELH